MDDYGPCKAVEALAIERLKPFLKRHTSKDGQFVINEKGPLAKPLQETIGDFIVNHRSDGRMRSIELKAERKATGNLFLEEWSNHNFRDRDSRARHAPNPGWFRKMNADILWYYFLDTDQLFVCDFMMLQQWAYGVPSEDGTKIIRENIINFPHKIQRTNGQMNMTTGRTVPIRLLQELGLVNHVIYPLQILQNYNDLHGGGRMRQGAARHAILSRGDEG